VEEDFWPYDKDKADIQISMAGVIAQKIIMGIGSRGCEADLDRARVLAYNIINKNGYSSCWETLPTVEPGSRMETASKRRRMERKIEKLLKSLEKKTIKYIKNNKDKVKTLGYALFEKKHLKSSEILAIIG
jgi:ATP-dependent Zn protease